LTKILGQPCEFQVIAPLAKASEDGHQSKPEAGQKQAAAAKSVPAKKTSDMSGFTWRIFKVPASQALVWAQVASNTSDYTLSQWAPIYYSEVLNVPLLAVGAHLAIPQVVAEGESVIKC
jgi:hypothetical protein